MCFSKGFLMLLLWVCGSVGMWAQNVTISPQSGKVMSAKTNNTTSTTEHGFNAGFGSMWKHDQLPLTYVTSDKPSLSPNGVLLQHTCDIREYNGKLITNAGYYPVYSSIALPKGYRITSYKIVIKNNITGLEGTGMWGDMLTTLPFRHVNNWKFGEIDAMAIPNGYSMSEPKYKQGLVAEIGMNDPKSQTYTIERKTGSFGNTLYFCFFGNTGNNYSAAITFESIELTFAADDIFGVHIKPTDTSNSEVSLEEIPFYVGKTDIGTFGRRINGNRVYYSYEQNNVKEMTASAKLYEASAGRTGTWQESYDNNKTISKVKSNGEYWYGLRNGTYYVEAPNKVNATTNLGSSKAPIGYRIVGAAVEYAKPTKTEVVAGTYITWKTNSITKYLQPDATWGTQKVEWFRDSQYRYYTDHTGTRMYLSWGEELYDSNNENYFYRLSTTSNMNSAMTDMHYSTNGYLYVQINSRYYFAYIRDKDNTYMSTLDYSSYWSVVTKQQAPLPENTDVYKLKIYDQYTGELKEDVVMQTTTQTYLFDNLNNDAIKFGIEAPDNAKKALVRVALRLEPLNPYIYTVDVVCKGKQGEEITRTFTSSDFKLGGEKFVYKVPKGFVSPTNVQFTFRNLKSNYADETYLHYPGTDKARYSFIESKYYKDVYHSGNQYTHRDKVSGYPNDYLDKISVTTVGNIPFRFNNAYVLYNTNTEYTVSRNLEEYPFDMNIYNQTLGSVTVNKNGAISTTYEWGKFSEANAQLEDLETKVMYLFTTDETRYNIAPTTKEFHRAFAYYNTKIQLQMADYTPKVEWKKIYNTTNYYKDASNKDAQDAMYGAVITTEDAGYDNAWMNAGSNNAIPKESYGYLTLNQIKKAMEQSIRSASGDKPKSMKQVLYVDNSQLYSIVATSNAENAPLLAQGFRSALGENAVVYLPFRATAQLRSDDADYANNVAISSETQRDVFTSNQNFILKDRHPFYAPKSIQLGQENYATYSRIYTWKGRGNTAYSTIVLPYALTTDNKGMHDGQNGVKSKFTIYKMKDNGFYYYGVSERPGYDYITPEKQSSPQVKFEPVTEAKANIPYLISLPYDASQETVFEARQKGALIAATPTKNEENVGSNSTTGVSSFKYTYTYSGTRINNPNSKNYFYFSINRFLAVKNSKNPIIYFYPFRAFYEFSTGYAPAKAMTMFDIVLDDIEAGNKTTGIDNIEEQAVLMVTTDINTIVATASKDVRLSVYAVSGQMVAATMLKAGETRTYTVPKGLYIVNGKKMMVK